MKFEELSKERQEEEIERHRETNIDYDWWDSCLEDICEQVSDRVGIKISEKEMAFDFFSKGHSGLWITNGGLSTALQSKYPNLEDLDISNEFGVWAYIGLRRDEVDKDDIEFYREEEDEDLADLLRERVEEEDKEKVKGDIDEVLDIFDEGYNALYKRYAYLTSDEGVVETIKCNEMEFEDELEED